MVEVKVVRTKSDGSQETFTQQTNGCIVLYLDKDVMRSYTTIEMSALTPVLLKYAMEKFVK